MIPKSFNDAQQIADQFKDAIPVILNLQGTDTDLSKRLIDFASGLTYALDGGMQRIADKVFLLTPRNVEVSAEERARLIEKGFFNQSSRPRPVRPWLDRLRRTGAARVWPPRGPLTVTRVRRFESWAHLAVLFTRRPHDERPAASSTHPQKPYPAGPRRPRIAPRAGRGRRRRITPL